MSRVPVAVRARSRSSLARSARSPLALALAAWVLACAQAHKPATTEPPHRAVADDLASSGAAAPQAASRVEAPADPLESNIDGVRSELDRGMISCGTTPPPVCGPHACGNGKLDRCTSPARRERCPPERVSEPCDGANLGKQSCVDLGYVSGKLRCAPTCEFDGRACLDCEANPHVLGCVAIGVDSHLPTRIALAASDTEIAVAWGDTQETRFARFRPDLSPLDEGARTHGMVLGLAANASGWVLAAMDERADTSLYQLDASGAHARRLDAIVGPSYGFRMTARLHGGPLVLWAPHYTLSPLLAVILGNDGALETPRVPALFEAAWGALDALFVGDGFLIAGHPIDQHQPDRVKMIRQRLDGQVTDGRWFDGTENVVLALPSGGPTLVRTTLTGALVWMRLDTTGAIVGAPVPISDSGRRPMTGPLRAVGAGDATVVLLGQMHGGDALYVLPLGPSGTPREPPFPIMRGAFENVDMVRRGDDTIVAWTRNRDLGGVTLARVGAR